MRPFDARIALIKALPYMARVEIESRGENPYGVCQEFGRARSVRICDEVLSSGICAT